MKKTNIILLLGSFIFIGLSLSFNHVSDAIKVNAEPETATFIGFAGGWNPATHSGDNERYILSFKEELGENNATNYCSEIGDHFQINGESLKSISTSLRIGHNNQGAKNLFLDVPTNKIAATEEYPTPIFHIDGGTPFQDYLLPELTFIVNTTTYTMTLVEPPHQVEFSTIRWNGYVYGPDTNQYAGGQGNKGIKAGAMIQFNENLSKDANYVNGSLQLINLVNNPLGNGIDEHIRSNGVPFKDIEGAEIYYYMSNLMFLYTPDMNTPLPNKNYAELTFDANEKMFDVLMPDLTLYYEGIDDIWKITKPADANEKVLPFNGINSDTWNNMVEGDNRLTIIDFGENGVDFFSNDEQPNNTNRSSKNYSIGYKMQLNGKPFCEYPGTVVSYAHGKNHLFFSVPQNYLKPSNGYKVTTLHLDETTNFIDVALDEVTLYLFNGKWTLDYIDTISDDYYLTTNNYNDSFEAGDIEVGGERTKLLGHVPNFTSETDFAFEFKNDFDDGSFTIYAFSKDEYNGLRLTFDLKNNSISLLDNSKGIILDSLSYNFESYEWYRIYFKVIFNPNNTIDYLLAIDDIVYLTKNNIAIASMDYYGNNIVIYSGVGITSFNDPRPGSDIKKPVLTYTGDESYHYDVDSLKPDLKALCNAVDDVDGDVNDLIEIMWPDGSYTDTKLNKGVWDVGIKYKDASGNYGILKIRIMVTDPNEIVVTFDGNNPTYYAIGSLITKPEDPTKKEDKYASYTFIGWFDGDHQWDFENDVVTADLNLVSKFQKNDKKFTIIMIIEDNTNTLYLTYGEKIDLTVYKKDGYTMTVTCNGEEYKRDIFEVRGDATITIKYQQEDQPINPINPSKSNNSTGLYIGLACGGGCLLLGASIAAIIIEIVVLNKKKKSDKKA